jgi:hypothetical protein
MSDNPYRGAYGKASAPAVGRVAITPADTDLAIVAKALRIRNEHASTTAIIKITDMLGQDSTIRCSPGETVDEPVQVKKVWTTGSTVPTGCYIYGYVDSAA